MSVGRIAVRSMRLLFPASLAALMMLVAGGSWVPAVAADEEDLVEARPWVDPYPAVVTLKGYVVKKRFYGAPGYGETPKEDYKAEGWLLILDEPINIRGDEEDSESLDVRHVQLVVLKEHSKEGPALYKKLRSLLGQEVFASGMLYQGKTGWYWTPIGMDLQSIGLVPRGSCDSDCRLYRGTR